MKNILRNINGTVLLWLLVCLFLSPSALAGVRLPNVFSSHMVLQQQKPVIIWGWAEPNETVTIKLADKTQQVQANSKGEWKAELPALSAGGPYTLTVSGSSTVTCDDVLVGEVWLCSGQSNMEMGIGMANNGAQEIAAANDPNLRLLKVNRPLVARTARRHRWHLESLYPGNRCPRRLEWLFARLVIISAVNCGGSWECPSV